MICVCPECGYNAGEQRILDLHLSVTGHRIDHSTDPGSEKLPETMRERSPLLSSKGMKDEEYSACIANLGLLEGERVKLHFVCFRKVHTPSVMNKSGVKQSDHKGLFVLTNDNLIFTQQEGAWSSNYAQGLRLPLESIVGVSAQGGFLERIRLNVGITGTEVHEFWWGNRIKLDRHEVRGEIEAVLKGSREERKKAAQVAISAGATPSMIFCRFCGARNKNDQMKCGNCGALLK